MPDDVIISPDTRRPDRLPPGQVETRQWPVEQPRVEIPAFDPAAWDFTVFPVPLVDAVKRFTWAEFQTLPRVKVFADFHDVTGVSRLNNLWEGVSTRELLNHVTVSPDARFVMAHCEFGFSTNLPVDDFFAEDSLFAFGHDGAALTPDRGYPVRLIVPRLYAWKSVRWVRGIEFMSANVPGFLESSENGGYHMRGGPWVENSRHPDGERFRHADDGAG